MKINLDFQNKSKEKEPEYVTKEALAKTIGNIAKDYEENNQKTLACISGFVDTIKTLNYNRERDMNFILDVISGGKYDRKTRETYLAYCQEYDRLNKENKDV